MASEDSKSETKSETSTIICPLKSTISPTSQRAFNWILRNPLGIGSSRVVLLHVAPSKKKRSDGELILKSFLKDSDRHRELKFTFETALLEVDKHGVGHTIKAYCRDIGPLLLVVGDASKRSPLRNYFCECDCYCPVVFVKSEFNPTQSQNKDNRYEHLAVGVSENEHSQNGFQFLLENLSIAKTSQLVVVHVVTNKETKPIGRDFLASFKPFCKGRPYAIRSALVYARKERTIPGGLATFCRDRKVEILSISPKPQGGKKARVGGKIMTQCMENVACDILIFKNERTQPVGGGIGFVPKLGAIGPRLSSKWISVGDSAENVDESEDSGYT